MPLLSCFWRLKITDQFWILLGLNFKTLPSHPPIPPSALPKVPRPWRPDVPVVAATHEAGSPPCLVAWRLVAGLATSGCVQGSPGTSRSHSHEEVHVVSGHLAQLHTHFFLKTTEVFVAWQKAPAKDTSNGSQSSRRPLSPCPSVTGNPISNLCHWCVDPKCSPLGDVSEFETQNVLNRNSSKVHPCFWTISIWEIRKEPLKPKLFGRCHWTLSKFPKSKALHLFLAISGSYFSSHSIDSAVVSSFWTQPPNHPTTQPLLSQETLKSGEFQLAKNLGLRRSCHNPCEIVVGRPTRPPPNQKKCRRRH